jgi:uncharacterized membrane protein
MDSARIIRHLATPAWLLGRVFTPAVLAAIEQAVKDSETLHRGEIRFAVEAGLDLAELRHGITVRQRAIKVFSDLGVWDTAENTGVLIYVQWLDRRVEVIADRGIAAVVPQAQWEAICRAMEAAFRAKRYAEGSAAAVAAVGQLIARHFPAGADNPNELPDQPVLL